jgi:hypothetical protein
MFARIAAGLSLALLITLLAVVQLSAAPVADETPAIPAAADEVDATANQSALRINEYVASNATGLQDPDEPPGAPPQFPDWIEIYNPTDQAVSLFGLALTDNLDNPDKSPISAGLTIPAFGFIVFYADNERAQGPRHLDFALSGNGEEIGLYDISTQIAIDARVYGPQQTDISEGRSPDGADSWKQFAAPTPGQTNELNPPVIGDFGHAPAIPAASQSATVSATVTDNGTLVQVSVVYSIGAGSLITAPMTHGGGNLYTAVISGQPNGTLVKYKIYARDDQSNDTATHRKGYVVGYQPPQVLLSEIMAENRSILADPDQPTEYPDWVEVYNPNATPLNLGGLSLSDNPFEPEKFRLSNSLTIPANGRMLFYLDDDPEQGNRHGGFSLSKEGEFLGLYGGSGTVLLDSHDFGLQMENISIGLHPVTGQWVQLICASPGAPNIICDKHVRLPLVHGKP